MKFEKLLKCGLFSTTLFACGLTYGDNNFCPNCGYCLNPRMACQSFDMPRPPVCPCDSSKVVCLSEKLDKEKSDKPKRNKRIFMKNSKDAEEKMLVTTSEVSETKDISKLLPEA